MKYKNQIIIQTRKMGISNKSFPIELNVLGKKSELLVYLFALSSHLSNV